MDLWKTVKGKTIFDILISIISFLEALRFNEKEKKDD
jgi:hypothetical protein